MWRSVVARCGALDVLPEYQEALHFLRQGKHAKALGQLKRVREIATTYFANAPEHNEALHLSAAACFFSGNAAQALSFLRDSTDSKDKENRYRVALLCGAWDDTRPEWRAWVKDDTVNLDDFHDSLLRCPEKILEESLTSPQAISLGVELAKVSVIGTPKPAVLNLLKTHLEKVDGSLKNRTLGAMSRLYAVQGEAITAEGLCRTAVSSFDDSCPPREKLWHAECLESYAFLLDNWEKRGSEATSMREKARALMPDGVKSDEGREHKEARVCASKNAGYNTKSTRCACVRVCVSDGVRYRNMHLSRG